MNFISTVILLLTVQEGSDEKVDHSLFDVLLKKYVDGEGSVYYKGWKKSDADLKSLNFYLESLGKIDPDKLLKNERIAFWINIYNALTIKGILEFYPIKSIKDKVSSFFGFNIWKDYKVKIGGKDFSLDHIEHEILRKMDQPLVHFGLVCASKGCPPLTRDAYVGKDVVSQLKKNAERFFKTKEKFRIDTNKNIVWLSPIFKWFWRDFGNSKESLFQFISDYVDKETKKMLVEGGYDYDWLGYDWMLNGREEPLKKIGNEKEEVKNE